MCSVAARTAPGELLGWAVAFGCCCLSRAFGAGRWELVGGMLGASLQRWTRAVPVATDGSAGAAAISWLWPPPQWS